MPAAKADIIEVIRGTQGEVEKLVSAAAESAWSKAVYDQGWNAKQLLCHIASTSGVGAFLINMAKAPGSGGMSADFDVDAWNVQAVGARQHKAIAEILEEIRGNCQRDIESVESAPGDLLTQPFKPPWGEEGSLADVIVGSIEEHLMTHVRDLAKAVG
jgi:hypothetical protein